VREHGPDAIVLDQPDLVRALERRLDTLGVHRERTEVSGLTILHHLSRPVTLEELAGYDADEAGPRVPADEMPDDPTS
jgi:hypothetical protein